MKFSRKASARWEGSTMKGAGTISTQGGVLDNTPYSFNTRFKEGKGTNPEELLSAAHAGCFTMQLSFLLSEANVEIDFLETQSTVYFEDGVIPKVELHLEGKVSGLTETEFLSFASKAKEICPVSKLYNCDIYFDAKLIS